MIKQKLKSFLPLLERFAKGVPFHPTTLTIASGVLAAGALGIAVGYKSPVAGFALFLCAFILDALDGMVARAKKLVSKEGAFLDGILDRVVEFLLILTVWISFPLTGSEQLALLLVLFFGTCMTAFVKAYAEHSQLLKHEEALAMPGMLERTERAVLLLAGYGFWILSLGSWASGLLYLTVGLSVLTVAQRMYFVLRRGS